MEFFWCIIEDCSLSLKGFVLFTRGWARGQPSLLCNSPKGRNSQLWLRVTPIRLYTHRESHFCALSALIHSTVQPFQFQGSIKKTLQSENFSSFTSLSARTETSGGALQPSATIPLWLLHSLKRSPLYSKPPPPNRLTISHFSKPGPASPRESETNLTRWTRLLAALFISAGSHNKAALTDLRR